ncbi:MAG: alpha/beta fold hydrolase, partial [Chloroflexia bacterium]|nr:alpha/beta fold hydrolase [Chloroflexia bacterium]
MHHRSFRIATAAALFIIICILLLHPGAPLAQGRTSDADPLASPSSALSGEIAYVHDGYIWLIDLATRQSRKLLTDSIADPAWAFTPSLAWSPDGQLLAFERSQGTFQRDIYTVRADGTGLTRVTNSASDEYSPSFSLSGQLYFFRAAESDLEVIKRTSDGQESVVHRCGGFLVFCSNLSVYGDALLAYTLSGTDPVSNQVIYDLVSNQQQNPGEYFYNESNRGNCDLLPGTYGGRWAGTQPQLAFVGNADCVTPGRQQPDYGIFTIAAGAMTGTSPVLLHSTSFAIASLAWSPDDQWLVMGRYFGDGSSNGLWLIDTQGQQLQQISTVGVSPAWRPGPPAGCTDPGQTTIVSITGITDHRQNNIYPLDANPTTPEGTVEGNTVLATVKLTNCQEDPVNGEVALSHGAARADATILPLSDNEVTLSFNTDGLAWINGQRPTQPYTISASFTPTGGSANASEPVTFTVRPRPTILVHGYNSDPSMWNDYRGAQLLGSSELEDIVTYTVPRINTGSHGSPTNTIDQNAYELSRVVERARREQGADQVDIIAHSMGGLISRRYLNLPGSEGSVRQLIMLGTPNRGSISASHISLGCGIFNLGFLEDFWPQVPCRSPAVQELTVSSVDHFNTINTNSGGARFYVVAGQYACLSESPAANPFEIPLPNDIIVSTQSAFWIAEDNGWLIPSNGTGCQGHHQWLYRIGDARYGGGPIFTNIVRPLLTGQSPIATPASEATLTALPTNTQDDVQFTTIQSGTLSAGGQLEFQQRLEPGNDGTFNFVVVGSPDQFTVSLRSPDNLVYTPGSSDPTVRYTQLSTDLLPLAGYTVSSTLAGDWAVIVEANDRTLVEGIPVAVMGSLQSALRLTPQIIDAPVSIGDSVTIAARLSSAADPLLGATLTGLLEVPGGSSMVITLRDDGRSGDGTAG